MKTITDKEMAAYKRMKDPFGNKCKHQECEECSSMSLRDSAYYICCKCLNLHRRKNDKKVGPDRRESEE